MEYTTIDTTEGKLRIYLFHTVVIGTGAAGLNAADRLYQYGVKDIAIVTEGLHMGTSRNTGSDKQTYYKMTLAGSEGDSVGEMADTLFQGQCVDGDIALCEAALSAQSFLRLAELGVPFPQNRYGEFVGYKTDHDPRSRATSVGPYTSRMMTECLEKAVKEKQIEIYDNLQVIRLLTDEKGITGVLCLDKKGVSDPDKRFVAFRCGNIVYATGGPAGIYGDSVYPREHCGATGTALLAGAKGRNLTEWQYGLASVNPRWNVSGTYMQVIPRFLSTASDGSDPSEFLLSFFKDKGEMMTKVFLKGYQWPFDVCKIDGGSSMIDILVYLERMKGRKVFLDFRDNPGKEEICYASLSEEARTYLDKAGACFGTPIERLMHMNQPAVEFYKARGVDLREEPLEIALCAQHNNGGLAVDSWWQTNIQGLFAVGEAAATHGVYRPGGTALNAGQVGSTRAAQYISAYGSKPISVDSKFLDGLLKEFSVAAGIAGCFKEGCEDNVKEQWAKAAARMSRFGGPVRSRKGMESAAAQVKQDLDDFLQAIHVSDSRGLSEVYRYYDILHCQSACLASMLDYMDHGGKSRGSALYSDPSGKLPYQELPSELAFKLDHGEKKDMVQETVYREGACEFQWRKVRPVPDSDDFFENVWRTYREHKNIIWDEEKAGEETER